ncbi:MAG TPA: permease-like cell division protein FtsX [Actinomycetota bacterium]|jgi:hypothetical protein
MQSSMGDRLKRAAAVPARPLDLARARRRGLAQRVMAVALAALGAGGVVAGAALAYPRVVDAFDHTPASGSAGGPCQAVPAPGWAAVVVDDATEAELQEVRDFLGARPEVASFHYVRKAEAFRELEEIYEGEPGFWSSLDPRTLPASFRFELHDDADGEAIEADLAQLAAVDGVYGPHGEAFDGLCAASTVVICPPAPAADIAVTVSHPHDGDVFDHFGIHLAVAVPASEQRCARTLYVELDGVPQSPPDGSGPDAGELGQAPSAAAACIVGNTVSGDLLYTGRHTVAIGTGCDPSSSGPYATQRAFDFDGDERRLVPAE